MNISGKQITYQEIFNTIVNGYQVTAGKGIFRHLKNQRIRLEQLIKAKTIYGVNTGFGGLKSERISFDDIEKLQENLIVSHAAGVGKPLPQEIVKTIMILIAVYLSKGFSGIRPEILETLLSMINKNVIPEVFEKGSVGASGDLIPSAHIALSMIGKGRAYYKGKKLSSKKALEKASIKPLVFKAKEGLAIINNTATMTALGIFALSKATYLADLADIAGSLSSQVLLCCPTAFDNRIHNLKPHPGQIEVAKRLREFLKGTTMVDNDRIQDQYSIRCMPQVHGAVREVITFAERIINTEINSVTDNPLIFFQARKAEVLSGGNFHGEVVAFAMDTLKMGIAELANISDRRIASILDSNHNFGLPLFLAKNPGLNSGLMIVQYLSASLVSENKILAHPAVVDSIPTSANTEDFVSMGTIAARKTLEASENTRDVLAAEFLVSCQAADFRLSEGYHLGGKSEKIYRKIRRKIPFLNTDHEIAPLISKISKMIDSRKL